MKATITEKTSKEGNTSKRKESMADFYDSLEFQDSQDSHDSHTDVKNHEKTIEELINV